MNNKLFNYVDENKSELYLGIGIGTGVVAAIMAVSAAPKAAEALRLAREGRDKMSKARYILEDVKTIAPYYAPSLTIAAFAVTFIGGSYKITTQKYITQRALTHVAESRFAEYQKKVIEKLGEEKEGEIRKEIVEEKTKELPPPESENGIIHTGHGDDLFYDFESGRWFRSSIDYINNSITRVGGLNEELKSFDEVSLNRLYSVNDIPEIGLADGMKWRTYGPRACKSIEICFEPSDSLTETGKPYIVMSFWNRPTAE